MKITLESENYDLNIERAIDLGVLTPIPKTRPVYVKDIPNGSVFRWKSGRFVMRDNTATSPKQCIQVSGSDIECPEPTWFAYNTELTYWDEKRRLWIKEVENG